MKLKDKEDGMIMVEAIYVVVISMVVILITANFATVFHNRMVVTSVANETASAIAEIYGSVSKEPKYAYTSPSYFYGRSIYRYISHSKIKDIAEKKAKWYGSYLLYKSEFAKKEGDTIADIDAMDVKCEKNEMGLWTINVTIKKKYPVLLFFPPGFMGMDLEYDVEAEGTAVCYDAIHQMNKMSLVNEITKKVEKKSKILSGFNNIRGVVRNVMSIIEKSKE